MHPRGYRSPRSPATWHPILLLPPVVASLVGLGMIVAGLGHGFDWTDEAFVWTMIDSDRVAVGEPWGFQHLLHPVFVAVGESVLAMRTLRLVGYLAVALGLTMVASRVLRPFGVWTSRREWWFILLVAQAGTLLAWSYPTRYLGYNELAAWISAALCGVLALGLLPGSTEGRARRLLPWALAGVLLAPLMLAKITAAIIWGVLVLVAVLVPGARTPILGRLAVSGAGFFGSVLLLVLVGVPYLRVVESAFDMIRNNSEIEGSSHSIDDVLATYVVSTIETGKMVIVPVMLLFVLMLLCLFVRQSSVWWGVAGLVLVVCAGGTLVSPAVRAAWTDVGGLAGTVGASGGLALLFFLVRHARSGSGATNLTIRGFAVLTLALVAPLVAAVGTNNPIWGHAIFAATTWAVLLGAGLCLLSRAAPAHLRPVPLLAGGMIVGLCATSATFDVLQHPYRTSPLLAQTTRTEVPSLDGIRLTTKEAEIADWLHQVSIEQAAADVPAVSLNNPGFLFFFNSSDWSNQFRGVFWQESIARNCANHVPEDLFILEPQGPGSEGPGAITVEREKERLNVSLAECELEFPEDFTAVARHEGATVWRLESP